MGRRLSTGLGASFAALDARAFRRLTFLPGCGVRKKLLLIAESVAAYLVEMTSNSALPVLSKVCYLSATYGLRFTAQTHDSSPIADCA